MFRNLALNRVILSGFGLLFSFFFLDYAFGTRNLIIVLNGLLTGCGFAIAVTFWALFWQAIRGIRPYGDVRQFALSVMLMWFGIGLGVYSSVTLYSTGTALNILLATAAQRYVFVVAAVLQVFVPDYGLGLFYGWERRSFWLAGTLGAVSAFVAIFFQITEALAYIVG